MYIQASYHIGFNVVCNFNWKVDHTCFVMMMMKMISPKGKQPVSFILCGQEWKLFQTT